MPRLSPSGSAIQGGANAIISIDGAVPSGLSGYTGGSWGWKTPNLAVGSAQLGPSGDFAFYQYSVSGNSVTLVETVGGNFSVAGGGVWGITLAAPFGSEPAGVRTSIPGVGPFPSAAVADASSEGLLALITNRSTASGLSVYDAGGSVFAVSTQLTNTTVRVRAGVMAYQDLAGWHLTVVATGAEYAGFIPRAGIGFCVPLAIGSAIWLVEYDNAADQFSLRNAKGGTGFLLPPGVLMYYVDAIGLSGQALIAWATVAGEAPDSLVTLAVNVSTGTTVQSTVVSGVLVPGPGPTLERTTFDGSNQGGKRLPVQSQKMVNPDGTITKPWRDALQSTNNGLQGAMTQIVNIPVSAQAPGFGTIGTVAAPGPNATLLFTSADASVTITADQASQTIDLAATASGAGVPYFVPPSTTFTVPVNIQGLWTMPIDVEGTLVVDGYLVEVT